MWACVGVCVCTCACVGVCVRAYVLVCLCACECVGDLVWACVHLVWGATLGVSWMGAHMCTNVTVCLELMGYI